MEPFLSAIASDLLGRALSTIIQRYGRSKAEETEHKLRRLQSVLLRIDATVEEAEARYITSQAMLRRLEMLRQGMYGGHYMLDTFRYGGIDSVSGVAESRFRLVARRTCSSDKNIKVIDDAGSVGKLEKMLDGLETLMADAQEFVLFLQGYPRICRQPYSTYLILDKVMFGRQTEMETVLNFLLRPESPADDGTPGVLPIVGAARVGKSTLVEHVCLDERVRNHFSSIVFFTGHDLGAGTMAPDMRGRPCVVKHQADSTAASASHGSSRSLAVVELAGGMDAETWRRLYASAARFMERGSKIIITSRSENTASFGTVPALRLNYLNKDAYWYFFKALAFGSAEPGDQPKLASIGMEIAVLLKGSFLGANIVGGLMGANLNTEFWSRVLESLKDFTRKHRLMYGEDPTDLLRRGRPVFLWRLARTQHAVTVCSKVYRVSSPQNCGGSELPTAQDILAGRVTDQLGDFCMVSWRSSIPPYNTYLARCMSHKIRCSSVANKKRPRYTV